MRLIRAVAIAVVTLAALLFGSIIRKARHRPRPIKPGISTLYCRAICRLFRIRVSTRNQQSLAGPVLLVANHVSWTDVLVLGSLAELCFVAKKEVASWPVLGALARNQGCVFIDRTRRMQIPNANLQIAEQLTQGLAVVLFAEATTGDGTRVKPFRSSHFAAIEEALRMRPDLNGILVQPVSIVYKRRDGLPLGRNGRAAAAWYGDMEFLPSLKDLLWNGPLECEASFGQPIEVARDANRKTVAAKAQACVRSLAAASLTGRTGAETATVTFGGSRLIGDYERAS